MICVAAGSETMVNSEFQDTVLDRYEDMQSLDSELKFKVIVSFFHSNHQIRNECK